MKGRLFMRDNGGALDKLYSMLRDSDSLGLSRTARLRLIGVIGSLETEELDRFRSRHDVAETERSRADSERSRQPAHH